MSPFAAHRRREADARLAQVRIEAAAALEALRSKGVEAQLIGSVVRGDFKLHSDVDFLVMDAGTLSTGLILDCITDHVRTASVDLVFADAVSAEALVAMRKV